MATQSISGLTKIAEGREAEIFAWEDGTVVKLYRHAGSGRNAASESAAMAAAKAAGGPVPASRGVIELEGRSGLIMDRIEGTDLLTIIGRKPWPWWRRVVRADGRTRRFMRLRPRPGSNGSCRTLFGKSSRLCSSRRICAIVQSPSSRRCRMAIVCCMAIFTPAM